MTYTPRKGAESAHRSLLGALSSWILSKDAAGEKLTPAIGIDRSCPWCSSSSIFVVPAG
jgi:hypothetical protein